MNWQFSPYVIPVIVAALLSLILAYCGWRQRPTRGALWFSLMMFAVFWWSAAFALEFMRTDLAGRLFFAQLESFGNLTTPTFFFIITLAYSDREHWITRRNIALLFLVPALVTVLIWTNGWHELVWIDLSLDTSGEVVRLHFERGPVYWLNTIYNYFIVAGGFVILIRSLLRSATLYRRQVLSLLLGAFMPIIANVLYLLEVTPPDLELTPVAFSLTGLVIGWGVFRYQLFDILPVAHDRLFENLADAVIVLDGGNRIIEINPAALEIFERQEEDAIGVRMEVFFLKWPKLLAQFGDTREANTEIRSERDEDVRYFALNISSLLNRRGDFTGRIIVLHNITESKNAQEELKIYREQLEGLVEKRTAELTIAYERLKELDHLKDEFISDISHELRTPITILKANLSLLELKPERLDSLLVRLQAATDRMAHLVEGIVFVTQMQQELEDLNFTPVDLNAVAAQSIDRFQEKAEECGLELTFNGTENMLPVMGNQDYLERALGVLISNALNYTPREAQVRVRTQIQELEEKQWVSLEVQNTGAIIPADELPRLFERFFRGRVALKTGANGVGLGLFIAKEIVESHGGRLEVENGREDGEGVMFRIWLPVHVA